MIAMADVERIAPPRPTLPSPPGRSVGSKRGRTPRGGPRPAGKPGSEERQPEPEPIERIDEYV